MSDTATGADAGSRQTLGFQAEVKQLLHLMIHSLYSNKEIFLRELVSNASDACDRLRFESIGKPELLEGDSDLGIEVSLDQEARTISVSDNGIGMSREEAVTQLGTIARSGTREFFASLTGDQQKDAQLIGQFGVGFYSSFIVADRVTVISRRAGLPADAAVRWESDGAGEFTVDSATRARRGTDVVLHLKPDQDELLSGARLKAILRRYSDHIATPIRMRREEWDKDRGAYVTKDDTETVNQANALWARAKSDITEEQYKEFYKHVAHDFAEALAWTHNRVEGTTEYIQLLYLPSTAPFDLWDREHRHGIKLYVRRVFIMDDAEQLLPVYLRFVRGVIDSADLPLNVSREILQESRDVRAIREGSTRRILGLLEDLAANRKDVEVLLMTDRVDEWMLSFLHELDGVPLVSVAKGDLDLGELADAQEKEAQQKVVDEYKDLVARVKAALGEKVKDVRVTLRLTDSPACIVADRDAMSLHLSRLLKAAGQKAPEDAPILELNPQHALVQRLKTEGDARLAEWATLLLEEAQLAEGAALEDPAAFVRRVNALLMEPRPSP
jgi:molecular chaperone HtpG